KLATYVVAERTNPDYQLARRLVNWLAPDVVWRDLKGELQATPGAKPTGLLFIFRATPRQDPLNLRRGHSGSAARPSAAATGTGNRSEQRHRPRPARSARGRLRRPARGCQWPAPHRPAPESRLRRQTARGWRAAAHRRDTGC